MHLWLRSALAASFQRSPITLPPFPQRLQQVLSQNHRVAGQNASVAIAWSVRLMAGAQKSHRLRLIRTPAASPLRELLHAWGQPALQPVTPEQLFSSPGRPALCSALGEQHSAAELCACAPFSSRPSTRAGRVPPARQLPWPLFWLL